jgi:hypothetical protein
VRAPGNFTNRFQSCVPQLLSVLHALINISTVDLGGL